VGQQTGDNSLERCESRPRARTSARTRGTRGTAAQKMSGLFKGDPRNVVRKKQPSEPPTGAFNMPAIKEERDSLGQQPRTTSGLFRDDPRNVPSLPNLFRNLCPSPNPIPRPSPSPSINNSFRDDPRSLVRQISNFDNSHCPSPNPIPRPSPSPSPSINNSFRDDPRSLVRQISNFDNSQPSVKDEVGPSLNETAALDLSCNATTEGGCLLTFSR